MEDKELKGLEEIVEGDGSLKKVPKKQALYKSYANLYSQDLIDNLELTSIELDEKYATNNPVSWRKFLNHTSVRNFIDSFLLEKAEKKSMQTISAGSDKASEALKIKEMTDKKRKGEDNSNIVVFFMPQKDYTFNK